MGIPSYYKKLIDTVPGLVVNNGSKCSSYITDIQWLFMDYNCLIYHCLHRHDTPVYAAENESWDNDSWELEFLECVVKYTMKVIKKVDPKLGVFIAVDGVVPMAKMRQQRLRRFKSIWLTQHPECGANSGANSANAPVWDRNSITPGTDFMKKLRKRLEHMIRVEGKKTWVLSSSDEPGEGEHKIIAAWRSGNYTGNFAVYGLDADLIVLTILGRELCGFDNKVWLFREEVNAGKMSYDAAGEELFEWFSINALSDWLASENNDSTAQRPTAQRPTFILNYCFAMSVLGNDFLPGSLGLKIREDGHSELLDIIRTLTRDNIALINPDTLHVSYEGLKTLFTVLSADEEPRIQKYIHKKQMIARGVVARSDDIKLGDNNWPLAHIEENVLVGSNKQLLPNWKETYLTQFFNGLTFNKSTVNRVCNDYLYGIQWIWAYYSGAYQNVCFNWFYAFNLPPLWIWLKDYLNESTVLPEFPEKVLVRAVDIRPVEQLVLVLPLESWSLIPPCLEKRLPQLAPQFYPSSFSFESVGKRYFWECESMIPLLSILEVKEITRHSLL
jgi:5'-3' exonuclease